jgi:hypothetical protein
MCLCCFTDSYITKGIFERRERVRTLTILALFAILPLAPAKQELLTRTLYVSLGFKTCEHIENAYLYAINRDGQEVSAFDFNDTENIKPYGRLPLRREFTFTYYPHLEEMLPKLYLFKVKGTYQGQEVVKYVALGRSKLLILNRDGKERLRYVGEGPMEARKNGFVFDFSDKLEKFNYWKYKKRDVRITLFTINVECARSQTLGLGESPK